MLSACLFLFCVTMNTTMLPLFAEFLAFGFYASVVILVAIVMITLCGIALNESGFIKGPPVLLDTFESFEEDCKVIGFTLAQIEFFLRFREHLGVQTIRDLHHLDKTDILATQGCDPVFAGRLAKRIESHDFFARP